MTPADLRKLVSDVAEAKPRWKSDTPEGERLISLAPDLALLVADWATDLHMLAVYYENLYEEGEIAYQAAGVSRTMLKALAALGGGE